MFATADDVLEVTGYSVDDTDIRKAQAVIEVFAGKVESLITNVEDLAWMRYAVAWQTAYMASDENSIFEQANIQSLAQNDTKIDFGNKDYVIAPLAQKAVRRLSWNRSRSVPTAPHSGYVEIDAWEVA